MNSIGGSAFMVRAFRTKGRPGGRPSRENFGGGRRDRLTSPRGVTSKENYAVGGTGFPELSLSKPSGPFWLFHRHGFGPKFKDARARSRRSATLQETAIGDGPKDMDLHDAETCEFLWRAGLPDGLFALPERSPVHQQAAQEVRPPGKISVVVGGTGSVRSVLVIPPTWVWSKFQRRASTVATERDPPGKLRWWSDDPRFERRLNPAG